MCSISEIECILSMENEDFTPWCNICIFPSHFSVVSAISVLHTLLWRHSSFTLSSYIRWQYLYFVLLNHNKRAKSVRIEQYLYFLCHILVTRSISANPNFFEKKNYLVKQLNFKTPLHGIIEACQMSLKMMLTQIRLFGKTCIIPRHD